MSFDKYSTFAELIEERERILARPFPQGYSQEEADMMRKVEEFCTRHFLEALETLRMCRNRLSSDPSYGACPLGLDELIKKFETVEGV